MKDYAGWLCFALFGLFGCFMLFALSMDANADYARSCEYRGGEVVASHGSAIACVHWREHRVEVK